LYHPTIMRRIFPVYIILLFWSCTSRTVKDEKPLARVFDEYLYLSDMKDILKNAQNHEDSLSLIKNFTDKWAKKQVIYHLAEVNLSDENKDVASELENYKLSLLIYKYQQLFVSQKLDTVISEAEFSKYYDSHPDDFILDRDIVKTVFVQLPNSAPGKEKIKGWMTSGNEKDIQKLDEYCAKYAYKYDDFTGGWVSFSTVGKLLPVQIDDVTEYIKNNKYAEYKDSSYTYCINLKEYQLAGTNAPAEFAREMIKPVILTQRKVVLLNNLENNAFNAELNNKNVEIYHP
jgi:hypothetical protein